MNNPASSSKRHLALRADSVIQAIWAVVLVYDLAALSSTGVNSDTLGAGHLLLVWQTLSALLFVAWKGGIKRWRALAAVVLPCAFGLLILAVLLGLVLSLLTLSNDPIEQIPLLAVWLIVPVQAAYLTLTGWEAWFLRPQAEALESVDAVPPALATSSLSPSEPVISNAGSTTVVPKGPARTPVMPLITPWLRFVIPTLLLIFALNHFYVNLGEQIAGEDWSPAVFCAVTLLAGWIFSRRLVSQGGMAWALWSRLWWVAAIPLCLLVLTFLPPVRRQMRWVDHARVPSWKEYPGPLGLAQRRHLYAEDTAEELLGKPGVVEAHLKQYEEDLSPYTDLRADRHALALYFAALRLRGETLDVIAARSLGPHLVVAAVLAEADPPYWWPKAEWLRKKLSTTPAGTFQLGMVDRAQAAKWLDGWCQPNQLSSSMSADAVEKYNPMTDDRSLWQKQGRSSALARGLVQVSLRHAQLLPASTVDRLLVLYQQHAAPALAKLTVEGSLEARAKFRQWAAPLASAEGKLPISLELDPTLFPYVRVRSLMKEKLEDFVRSCGYQAEWLAKATGQANVLEPRLAMQTFPGMSYTTEAERSVTRVVPVRKLRMGNRQGYETSYQDEVQIIRNEQERTGSLEVTSIELHFGSEAVVLRPAETVLKMEADLMRTCLKARKFPDSIDKTSLIYIWYYMHGTALSGWRYGLPVLNEKASPLYSDGWDDVRPDEQIWQ